MLYFKINNRRYTGSKFKLLDWIKNTIEDETQKNDTFCDLLPVQDVLLKNLKIIKA